MSVDQPSLGLPQASYGLASLSIRAAASYCKVSRQMGTRRAMIGDEVLLRRLRLEALTLAPEAFGSTLDRELARTTEDWRRWLSPGVVFFLEDEAGPHGLVAGAHDPDDPAIVQLMAMWVHPEARGTGGANALVTAVMAWAQSERARTVQLQVVENNLRARRCYERNGFVATGRKRLRERDGAVELQMERAVARYHDDSVKPSDAGGVRLVRSRLYPWRPNSLVNRIAGLLIADEFGNKVDEHLRLGDSRAAVVVSVRDLLIAAYTDELDCIVMLRFPQEFVSRFNLRVGARLLTVNTYFKRPRVAPDLVPGPRAYDDWQNVNPLIAEFLSEDSDWIARRKAEIDEEEWDRCALLGHEYLRRRPGVARDGSPYKCMLPADIGDTDDE